MGGRGEELLIGALCAVLALLILRRIALGLRSGEVPLYRTRLKRAEAGEARFWALILLNGASFVLLFFIAADLLLGLGLSSGRLSLRERQRQRRLAVTTSQPCRCKFTAVLSHNKLRSRHTGPGSTSAATRVSKVGTTSAVSRLRSHRRANLSSCWSRATSNSAARRCFSNSNLAARVRASSRFFMRAHALCPCNSRVVTLAFAVTLELLPDFMMANLLT